MDPFFIESFFDDQACCRIRHAMDRGAMEAAEVLVDGGSVDAAVRRTSDVEVDARTLAFVERAFDDVRPRVAAFHGVTLSTREGAGFLRYPTGGFYRPHHDRAHVAEWSAAARRRITIVVFLNDDFDGGELCLLHDDAEPVVVTPRAGTLVAFDAATVHEVRPVGNGTRDTVVDWYLDES